MAQPPRGKSAAKPKRGVGWASTLVRKDACDLAENGETEARRRLGEHRAQFALKQKKPTFARRLFFWKNFYPSHSAYISPSSKGFQNSPQNARLFLRHIIHLGEIGRVTLLSRIVFGRDHSDALFHCPLTDIE